ncbi:MAG: TraB/GumN family protein [Clostridia bacterium]|nr:TraB/GumN family protein [Clostridia bacterium]
MKKRISFILAAILILFAALTAVSCGRENGKPEASSEVVSAEAPSAEESSGEESSETVSAEVPSTEESSSEDNSEEVSAEDSSTEENPGTIVTPPEENPISPLLWRVTDADGHKLYLFGTIHVGDERNDTVLEKIVTVLDACDALAVEFDVVAYESNLEQMVKDLMQYVLLDGSVVSDYLPEDLYQRSYELLEQANMTPAAFTRYNLAWWAQMVESAMMVVYSDLKAEKAMDSLLIGHAYEKGMPVLEVESSSFQMGLLNGFDNELYRLQIEEALESADIYGSELNQLYSLWLSGDREAFWTSIYGADQYTGDYSEEQLALLEEYNRQLLDERNIGMRDRAIEYLASGDTVFFAVGSAHMANDVGLVQLLSEAGYTVEEISY